MLTYSVAQPSHGRVAIQGQTVTYAPDPGFDGLDAFAYTASDGQLMSAPAQISVVVTDAPNLAPVFIDPTPDEGETLIARDGQEFTFILAARDPDTQPMPLVYDLTGAPDAAAFDPNTGVFTWTPDVGDIEAQDELELLARATDGLATIERTIKISLELSGSDSETDDVGDVDVDGGPTDPFPDTDTGSTDPSTITNSGCWATVAHEPRRTPPIVLAIFLGLMCWVSRSRPLARKRSG